MIEGFDDDDCRNCEAAYDAQRAAERRGEELVEENARLTAWLVWAMDELDNWVAPVRVPAGLEEWRERGRVLAEKRKQEFRARALAKLSPEEREVLGISS